MSNLIEVANFALAQVGADSLESLDEKTREARAVKTCLPLAIEASLRAHDWPFARSQPTALAVLTETVEGWGYVYAYPSDCVRVLEILNPSAPRVGPMSTQEPIPFRTGTNVAGTARVVLTNQEDALALYTRKVTNPVLFDALFAEALGWRLAALLAIPLRGDVNLQRSLMQVAAAGAGQARVVAANEEREVPSGSGGLAASRE